VVDARRRVADSPDSFRSRSRFATRCLNDGIRQVGVDEREGHRSRRPGPAPMPARAGRCSYPGPSPSSGTSATAWGWAARNCDSSRARGARTGRVPGSAPPVRTATLPATFPGPPPPTHRQRPQPVIGRGRDLLARTGIDRDRLPGNPSHDSCLPLVPRNARVAQTVSVIGDRELVAVGHDHTHTHIRIPPVARRPGRRGMPADHSGGSTATCSTRAWTRARMSRSC